jgi:glycogen debranching enzyme
MPETADSDDPFYIVATETRGGLSAPVLKHGDTFAVFDPQGDMRSADRGEHGLYHDGTRFLSHLQIGLSRRTPLLLSSGTAEHNEVFVADLTNPDILEGGHVALLRNVVHLELTRFLWRGSAHDRLVLMSYCEGPISLPLHFHFDADFIDIFEVRGTPVERRGERLPPTASGDTVTFGYHGLDGVVRTTRLHWSRTPDELSARSARFDLQLRPREPLTLDLRITCELSAARGDAVASAIPSDRAETPDIRTHDDALHEVLLHQRSQRARYCAINTSNPEFDIWLTRSLADVQMMCTEMPAGPYPYAGVPWYNTTFGRDGIITALELLWVNPSIARGALAHLAALQATHEDEESDAQPGKILHEARGGELAAIDAVPFRLYYGSIDSTPLFIMLAAAYYRRTGDLEFQRSIWPNIERALTWIDRHGDIDGDGFVEYIRHSKTGLVNQGWKDSHDAIFHADGSMAEPPIALCEVQGYVYQARRGAAQLAAALGQTAVAADQEARADALRERFEQAFWCEELATYGIALDGKKRLCRVRTSNAGHSLFTAIATPERARRVADQLMAPEFFSGWGVRTLATGEPHYNPMSYHNGSVWPHDNAMIASGLSRYRLPERSLELLRGLFEASGFMLARRLPELFCGFARRPGEGPTLYPVACSPQAWAAGAPFMLLRACLGLSIDAIGRRVTLHRTVLPELVDHLFIRNLEIGPGRTLDLLFERHAHDVGVTILRRDPEVEVVVLK